MVQQQGVEEGSSACRARREADAVLLKAAVPSLLGTSPVSLCGADLLLQQLHSLLQCLFSMGALQRLAIPCLEALEERIQARVCSTFLPYLSPPNSDAAAAAGLQLSRRSGSSSGSPRAFAKTPSPDAASAASAASTTQQGAEEEESPASTSAAALSALDGRAEAENQQLLQQLKAEDRQQTRTYSVLEAFEDTGGAASPEAAAAATAAAPPAPTPAAAEATQQTPAAAAAGARQGPEQRSLGGESEDAVALAAAATAAGAATLLAGGRAVGEGGGLEGAAAAAVERPCARASGPLFRPPLPPSLGLLRQGSTGLEALGLGFWEGRAEAQGDSCFTPLKLVEAFNRLDGVYRLSARHFLPPSKNECRNILNLAQAGPFLSLLLSSALCFSPSRPLCLSFSLDLMALNPQNPPSSCRVCLFFAWFSVLALRDSLCLLTLDGDETLYPDGENFTHAEMGRDICKLLNKGVAVAVVTGAGYGYESAKYAERLGTLFDVFHQQQLSPKAAGRFFVMGGESNYLLRLSPSLQLEPVPEELWRHFRPPVSAAAYERLLNVAERSLVCLSHELGLDCYLIRKQRAVGLVPKDDATNRVQFGCVDNKGMHKETLEEGVMRVRRDIRKSFESDSSVPYSVFTGGCDIWVDVGNKAEGVAMLQGLLSLKPQVCLHVGDQFGLAGNDLAASVSSSRAPLFPLCVSLFFIRLSWFFVSVSLFSPSSVSSPRLSLCLKFHLYVVHHPSLFVFFCSFSPSSRICSPTLWIRNPKETAAVIKELLREEEGSSTAACKLHTSPALISHSQQQHQQQEQQHQQHQQQQQQQQQQQ
ncbi:hypothetical protein Esti_006585 [Eimeria stiedai]